MNTLRCFLMFNSTSRFIIRIVFNVSKSPVGSSSSNNISTYSPVRERLKHAAARLRWAAKGSGLGVLSFLHVEAARWRLLAAGCVWVRPSESRGARCFALRSFQEWGWMSGKQTRWRLIESGTQFDHSLCRGMYIPRWRAFPAWDYRQFRGCLAGSSFQNLICPQWWRIRLGWRTDPLPGLLERLLTQEDTFCEYSSPPKPPIAKHHPHPPLHSPNPRVSRAVCKTIHFCAF